MNLSEQDNLAEFGRVCDEREAAQAGTAARLSRWSVDSGQRQSRNWTETYPLCQQRASRPKLAVRLVRAQARRRDLLRSHAFDGQRWAAPSPMPGERGAVGRTLGTAPSAPCYARLRRGLNECRDAAGTTGPEASRGWDKLARGLPGKARPSRPALLRREGFGRRRTQRPINGSAVASGGEARACEVHKLGSPGNSRLSVHVPSLRTLRADRAPARFRQGRGMLRDRSTQSEAIRTTRCAFGQREGPT